MKLGKGDFITCGGNWTKKIQPLVSLSRDVPFGSDWGERESEREWTVWNLQVVVYVLLDDGSDGWDGICVFDR